MDILKGFKKSNKKTKKEINWLTKNAYILGYEIGFYKHKEYVDWVQNSKNEILSKANNNRSRFQIIKAYDKGKKDGKKKDDRHLKALLGYGNPEEAAPLTAKEILKLQLEKKKNQYYREAHSPRIKKEGGLGVLRNPESSLRPFSMEKPRVISQPQQVKLPSIIRLYGTKRAR